MIAQFPDFFPDELVYSVLARYYMQSGYIRYTFAAEDLFQSKTVRPDIEFINLYTQDAMRMLIRKMSMEEVIEKHTMFPYYGRFLEKERRNKAFEALVSMRGNYHNLLPIPKRKDNKPRYLRYCPICVDEDRKNYGCTYWHRVHQMPGICACPKHGGLLVDSDVLISGKTSPSLISAEESVRRSRHEILKPKEDGDESLARYMAAVFEAKVDFEHDVTVGKFLHSRLENTPYRSIRGEQRNISLLHKDFEKFCCGLSENHFKELWQIQKVLTDDRVNFYEICLLAMFLDIQPFELVKMELPEQTQEERFDEQIFKLHEQGLKYPEIARRLNASYHTVKAIGEKRYKTTKEKIEEPAKSGKKTNDWEKIDRDLLSEVKKAIKSLYGNGVERPKKVTVFAIEKMLGLPSKRISLYLPLCKAEIEKNQETQEQYWAREVVWAIERIKVEGSVMNWKNIRSLTNMRKKDLIRSLKELEKLGKEHVKMVNIVL